MAVRETNGGPAITGRIGKFANYIAISSQGECDERRSSPGAAVDTERPQALPLGWYKTVNGWTLANSIAGALPSGAAAAVNYKPAEYLRFRGRGRGYGDGIAIAAAVVHRFENTGQRGTRWKIRLAQTHRISNMTTRSIMRQSVKGATQRFTRHSSSVTIWTVTS
jgi:hypothetical protein